MEFSSTYATETVFYHKEIPPSLAHGLEDVCLLFISGVILNCWQESFSPRVATIPDAANGGVYSCLHPVPTWASHHWRGTAFLSHWILEHCETGRNLIWNRPVLPVLLWAGETFLRQIHLVTLIFLWFNLVFIPKVGAQRMLPASQEYRRINESLLEKHVELLR